MSDALQRVPVFPLPRVVLFPGAVLALHVFEPRYREMVRDAMAGRGEIAMALPKPGWEGQYSGSPPVHSIGCLGSMRNVRPLSGGRFLFDLIGLSRVKFEEWRQLTPYRIARCSSLPEKGTGPLSSRAHEKALQLSVTFQALLQELSGMKGPLQLGSDLSLETTVNRICFALEIDAEDKQRLLAEDDIAVRAERAGEYLDAVVRALGRRRSNAKGPPN